MSLKFLSFTLLLFLFGVQSSYASFHIKKTALVAHTHAQSFVHSPPQSLFQRAKQSLAMRLPHSYDDYGGEKPGPFLSILGLCLAIGLDFIGWFSFDIWLSTLPVGLTLLLAVMGIAAITLCIVAIARGHRLKLLALLGLVLAVAAVLPYLLYGGFFLLWAH